MLLSRRTIITFLGLCGLYKSIFVYLSVCVCVFVSMHMCIVIHPVL